jgi:Outer membrane protein beta-barrel domain
MKKICLMFVAIFISLAKLAAQEGKKDPPPGGTIRGALWWYFDVGTPGSGGGAAYERAVKKKWGFLFLGITLGVKNSTVTGDSESYSGSVTGTQAGVRLPLYVNKEKYVIMGGLNYSSEGSKYKSIDYVPGGNSTEKENKVKLNYLRMPLTFRKYSRSGFYGEAGVQPGLLLSAKDKYDGQTGNLKDDYKKLDMGLLFGTGFIFKNKISIGLEFAPGISNINKKGGPNDGKKDRNRSLAFGVHYNL